MMLLNDHQIHELVQSHNMIDPFVSTQQSSNCISYGLSSFGYDMRVSTSWIVFKNPLMNTIADPKTSVRTEQHSAMEIVIPPGGFVLCHSVERFSIPDNVMVMVVGKSTYARIGLIVNVTPLEPGWEGIVTIELSNTNTVPVRVYGMEGIAQCLFFKGNRPTTTYADRNGRYQRQTGITLPWVNKS